MVKKLILGVTLGGSSRLLDGQAKYFRELGYEVYLISQDHPKEKKFCEKEGCTHLPVNIDNKINLSKDLISLIQIIKHFKRIKPDIVNVGTPKMGFLGIIAAILLGIKNRIYTCRGLRFEEEKGILRTVLMMMEKLAVKFASKVIYVGHSLRDKAKEYKTIDEKKSYVIEMGSSNGVDINYFSRKNLDEAKRSELIRKYNLSVKFVIGYLGRISKHKGSYELISAFEKLQKDNPKLVLVLAGHKSCSKELEKRIDSNEGIIYFPFTDEVPLMMSLFTIFVLPSWREGFANVPIQAASMGIPVITTDATGCIDSIRNNYNGIVYKAKSEEELIKAIKFYIENPEKITEHGQNGIEWAKNFKSETIWNGLEEIYSKN